MSLFLLRSLKSLEHKQIKVIETCEMIQIYAGRIQKEAEGKWKKALESRCDRAELEKKLCVAEGLKIMYKVLVSFVLLNCHILFY